MATIISANGAIRIPALRLRAIAPALRRRLGETPLVPVIGEPAIDAHWGEPGLAPVEKLFGWNSFEVLAWTAGSPRNPINLIPPRASAHCQIRYTVDSDPAGFLPAIRQALDEAGLQAVQVRTTDRPPMPATRTDPDHHWVTFARRSVERALPSLLREGMQITFELLKHPAFQEIVEELVAPAPEDRGSEAALDAWILRNVGTSHHSSSTCKMGPATDAMAVVDQFGKVHGLEGMRVADASIMPDCVRANTNVTVMVIGERVADFIKEGL